MQGQLRKKQPAEQNFFKEPKFHEELLEEKKQPQASNPIVIPSMSEGPMLLPAEQSKAVEQNARVQYEKALRIEIDALKGKKKKKAGPQKTVQKKKQKEEPPPKK